MTQELLRDDSLPYREYLVRPGDKLDYGIEWMGWLSLRWAKALTFATNAKVRPAKSTGFQYIATVGGLSANDEPEWPQVIGGTVVDGAITWTCEAADTTSLSGSIASSAWAPDSPLTTPTTSLTGTNATAYVNVPTSAPDGDYYVRNTITLTTTGLTKVGTFLFRVRAGRA